MSCGCGGLPPSVSLRLEAARLALAVDVANFDTLAPKVLEFVSDGKNLADLDSKTMPLAMGDSPEAVTSRNALINSPLQRIGALDRGVVAKLSAAGMHVLGALVQVETDRLGLTMKEAATLVLGLRKYGLGLGMAADDVRRWIVEGP